jgi:hypothetical protein
MRSIHTDFTRGAAKVKCDSITISLSGGIVFTSFIKLSLKFKFLTSKTLYIWEDLLAVNSFL